MKKQSGVAPSPTLTAGLRRYLYLTAACTGAGIMIVEILGAKMLAPFMGTSHFVWTAQIAVTLVALAAGYYAGGRLADHSPRPAWLYTAILVAALYLAATLTVVQPVAYACLGLRLALGSLLASAFLFFVPLALLAMTGPFLARIITASLEGVGGTVGRLTAVGTLGSFVGTLLIGYVCLPWLPNSVTMFATAGGLAGLALVYHLAWGRRFAQTVPLALAMAGTLGLGALGIFIDLHPTFTESRQIFRGNSNFGQLQVLESKEGRQRVYLNDFLVQNTYDPQDRVSLSMFTYMLHGLARHYTPDLQSVLCIGLGVGIVPMQFAHEGVRVDVAEINPAAVHVAREYFDLDPDKLHIAIADGRQFLAETTNRYDAVILDAFLGDSSPSHLMTREAFASIRRVLKPQGTLVINAFADFSPRRDFLAASLNQTLKDVFPGVRIHAAGNGNVFFVASPTELPTLPPPSVDHLPLRVREWVRAAFAGVRETDPAHGRVLTDDYNPAEFHDAANRERLHRILAQGMREL